jgi:hypothetical protein
MTSGREQRRACGSRLFDFRSPPTRLSLVCCGRGVSLPNVLIMAFSGDRDCGSRLACLAEDEQDADLSRHDVGQDSRRPDAGSQPEPGRAASVAAPAGPRAAPMRFFFGGRGSSCTPRGNSCMSRWLGGQEQLREIPGFGADLWALRRAMRRWTLECFFFVVCGQP